MNNVIFRLNDGSEIIEMDSALGDRVRLLKTKDLYQSVTYIDDRKYQLFEEFTNLYKAIAVNGNVNNTLVLGGGGFSYPKYYISTYPDKKMDVVEINKDIIDASYKYFFVDDLYNEYDSNRTRLNIICDDCINYMINCNKKYDAVFFDVYNEATVDSKYTTEEFNKIVLNVLNDNGYYYINYILKESNFDGFKYMMNTLTNTFDNYSIQSIKPITKDTTTNIFITFTNNKIDYIPSIKYYSYSHEDIIKIFSE